MLLVSFAAVTTLGFVAWLTGHYFEYAGIAAIGAILILAAGGAVALTQLEVQTGETVEKDYTTVNNSTVVNQTTTTYEHKPVAILELFGGPAGHLSFGGLVMLAGGLLMIQTLNEVSF